MTFFELANEHTDSFIILHMEFEYFQWHCIQTTSSFIWYRLDYLSELLQSKQLWLHILTQDHKYYKFSLTVITRYNIFGWQVSMNFNI